MNTFEDSFYGKEYAMKRQAFIVALNDIEQIHIEFFKGRKNDTDENDHDRLVNYYTTLYNGYFFSFRLDAELPQKIQEDCMRCYQKHWGTPAGQ